MTRTRLSLSLIVAAVLALSLSLPALGQDDRVVIRGAEVLGDPVVGIPIDVDLRDLPVVPPWKPGDPVREVPRRDDGSGNPVIDTVPRLDLLLEQQQDDRGDEPGFTESLNFEATSSGANPNDPTGDVGLNYFIEAINGSGGTQVAIYNKADGTLAAGPFVLDSLSSGGSCASGLGDPIVLFDQVAGRWVLTEFSSSGNGMCVYTSRETGDPLTGGWCEYVFSDSSFPDYPKYGVWPDLYLASSNQGNVAPVYAFDRVNMLSPDDSPSCPTVRATQKLTNAPGLPGLGFEAFTPADLDGPAPPAGSPAYFMRHRDEELNNDPSPSPTTDILEIWALDVDFDNAANTVFYQLPNVVVTDFDSNLCPPISLFSCIPQPSGPALDPLLEVVMNRLAYRNFGTHETLVGVLQTDVGDFADHSGERWFEIRKSGGGDWTLFQEGTFSPDADGRFMGMIAMDRRGGILLAYNVSSIYVYPSIRYTGRLATDPAGIMTIPEQTLALGGGSNSSMRYGDYNQMSVDPVDGCTFWFLGMYNPSSKGVRVGAVSLDACFGESIFEDGFELGNTLAWTTFPP